MKVSMIVVLGRTRRVAEWCKILETGHKLYSEALRQPIDGDSTVTAAVE